MLRVIGGEFKRRKLEQPSLETTRPTKDIAKEGLFNSLGDISNLSFLDCFGGSGAMGIEARSRGCKGVTIIEQDKKAFDIITKNVNSLGIRDIKLIKDDFFKAIKRLNNIFDIIFIDPPYKMEIDKEFINKLKEANIVGPNSRIIIERENDLPSDLFNEFNIKELKYGRSYLYILKSEE